MTIHVLIRNGAIAQQLAVLLREILAQDRFTSATALREQLEAEARARGLVATRNHIERALDLVQSNRALFTPAPPPSAPAAPVTPPPPTPQEARQTLQRFGIDVAGGSFRRKSGSRLVPL